jgi:hypothetical protein
MALIVFCVDDLAQGRVFSMEKSPRRNNSFHSSTVRQHQLIKQSIQRIAATEFIRSAIEDRADLSAFKEKPSPKVLSGLFAIIVSYIIGWPAIAALGFLAIQLHKPWIVVVGGPVTYGLSHLVFLLGMYLCGALYSLIFLRWLTRVSLGKLLAWAERK